MFSTEIYKLFIYSRYKETCAWSDTPQFGVIQQTGFKGNAHIPPAHEWNT